MKTETAIQEFQQVSTLLPPGTLTSYRLTVAAVVDFTSIRRSLTRYCAEQVRLRKETSRVFDLAKGTSSLNQHQLDAASAAFLEPGELLARRTDQSLLDVPY